MALNFQSGNPALSEKFFTKSVSVDNTETMTEKGTLNKMSFLMVLLIAAAALTWQYAATIPSIFGWMIGAAIIGFIIAIVLAFKPQWSPYGAPIYAIMEGVFLGGISVYFNNAFAETAPGIIMQAVVITFGTVIGMFLLYRFGIIKATEKFKAVVFTATAGIALFYFIAIVLRYAFHISIPFIHESTTFGIIFSLIVVAIAALNLILDFDQIDHGIAMGAPKYMEWYGAFGLMVTIVWLYIEVLRLLVKMSGRR